MTRSAYRSLICLVLVVLTAGVLPNVEAGMPTPSFATWDDLVKLRQEIRKLQKELEDLQKKIDEANARLTKLKGEVETQHAKAFDRPLQIEVGKKVSAWLDEHPKVETGEDVIAGVEDLLRSSFGAEVFRAARKNLQQIFDSIIDEGLPLESETRAARGMAEGFQATMDTSFELAWEGKLKQETKVWAEIEELEKLARQKRLDLEAKQRQQTATISARVPQQMIPVPRAENISLGWMPDTIIRLSSKLGDEAEKNKFCLLASPQVTTSVDEFMIDQFEVTHLAYWYFCQKTGHALPRAFAGFKELPGGKQEPTWVDMWSGGKIPAGMERFPITYVSRDDAEAFCLWTGSRLPTEFEWEVAARSDQNGFDGRIWPWGSEYEQQRCNDATSLANAAREKSFLLIPEELRDKMAGVVPVGTFDKGSTPLGIYDLAGNVAEWTASPFVAYNGYVGEMKADKGEKVVLTGSFFNESHAVFRGGHCDQRDMVVSAIFRGFSPNPRSPLKYVGFRRARSGIAGLDQMRYLMRNGRLDSRMQDFPLCESDKKAKRIVPQLDTRTGKFAIVEKFDWNEELQVSGEAHHILAINRATTDIESYAQMKRDTRGDKDIDESFFVGVLDTEVEFEDPPLERGTWFITFKAGRKYKDAETKKTVTLEDALIFVPEKTGGTSFRLDLKGSEVYPAKQVKGVENETKLIAVSLGADDKAKNDELICSYSFDISTGSKPKQAVVEFKLKAKKGALADFE